MSYDVYIEEFKDGEARSVTESDNNRKVLFSLEIDNKLKDRDLTTTSPDDKLRLPTDDQSGSVSRLTERRAPAIT